LILYVVADFVDPSIPGVFFFESKQLFVDVVIQAKSSAASSVVVATEAPMLFGDSAAFDNEDVAIKVQAFARLSLFQQAHRSNLKHDDSASFASPSPPDSSPTPPLS
jgi:hypothetical protein